MHQHHDPIGLAPMVKKSCGLPPPRGDLQRRNSFTIRTRRMGSKKYEAATHLAHHLVHHPDELDGVREDVRGQPPIRIQMLRKSRRLYSQDQNVIYRTPLSASRMWAKLPGLTIAPAPIPTPSRAPWPRLADWRLSRLCLVRYRAAWPGSEYRPSVLARTR